MRGRSFHFIAERCELIQRTAEDLLALVRAIPGQRFVRLSAAPRWRWRDEEVALSTHGRPRSVGRAGFSRCIWGMATYSAPHLLSMTALILISRCATE
jgi:hypothetical protein